MKRIVDIPYQENGHAQQVLDIHLPDQDEFDVFVYFHGGGLESGDKTYIKFIDYLVSKGIAVVSANYRMYPEAKYPDFLEDAASAVAWTYHNIGQHGKVKGIYVGGSSAGGYLSQMLCFDKSWLGKHGISPMDMAGFILDAGQPTCHYNVLRERNIDSRRVIVDESAPLYHVGADADYPPMLIIVSDNDMKNRLEQTQLLISTLKHFGHREGIRLKVMQGKHCGYLRADNQEGLKAFSELVLSFIRETGK